MASPRTRCSTSVWVTNVINRLGALDHQLSCGSRTSPDAEKCNCLLLLISYEAISTVPFPHSVTESLATCYCARPNQVVGTGEKSPQICSRYVHVTILGTV